VTLRRLDGAPASAECDGRQRAGEPGLKRPHARQGKGSVLHYSPAV
jgi:hypothetical protein